MNAYEVAMKGRSSEAYAARNALAKFYEGISARKSGVYTARQTGARQAADLMEAALLRQQIQERDVQQYKIREYLQNQAARRALVNWRIPGFGRQA